MLKVILFHQAAITPRIANTQSMVSGMNSMINTWLQSMKRQSQQLKLMCFFTG